MLLSLNVNFAGYILRMTKRQNQASIKYELLAFLKESHGLNDNNFSSSHSLKDAGIDSFKIIELILFLENKFQLSFPEESYTAQNLHSVDSILTCALGFEAQQ